MNILPKETKTIFTYFRINTRLHFISLFAVNRKIHFFLHLSKLIKYSIRLRNKKYDLYA